jgi:ubiquinol-cytochrome c reductase iron-sulfur subunit
MPDHPPPGNEGQTPIPAPPVPTTGDRQRVRLRLRVALKLMALGGLLAFIGMLLSALFSPPGGRGALPLEVALEAIPPGGLERLNWNGRRVLVLHRDAAMLAALEAPERLYDPDSRFHHRPGTSRAHRGLEPRWLVVYGEGTDLGCELDLVLPGAEPDWAGGFRDRCRGLRYDFAGRVHDGQAARRNLEIPPHRIDSYRLLLGPTAP